MMLAGIKGAIVLLLIEMAPTQLTASKNPSINHPKN
jgi:hypothetical protein